MSISFTYLSGRLTVYLSGELDHHAARETMRKITELLDEYLPRRCVLDLSALRFMDSASFAFRPPHLRPGSPLLPLHCHCTGRDV